MDRQTTGWENMLGDHPVIHRIVKSAVVKRSPIPDEHRIPRTPAASPAETNGTSASRLLRRADWRFLLPHPTPAKTAVFAEGLLGESIRSVASEPVDGTSAEATGCQLAVVRHPAAEELAAAFETLAPGGVCYSEWEGWRTGGPRGIRSRLERAGFTDVRVYWPIPSAESARAWLDILETTPRYRRVVRRVVSRQDAGIVARGLLPFVANVVSHLGLAPAPCAVAHKPLDTPGRETTVLDFPDRIAARIAQAESVAADELLFVTRAGGRQIDSKLNWPVFAGPGPDLRWIAKTTRRPEAAETLRREHDALVTLAEHSASRGIVVPRVVVWEELEGSPVLVEAALAGEDPVDRARRIGYPAVAEEITDALSTFAGRAEPTPRSEWWGQLLEPPLARLQAWLEPIGEGELVQAARAALSELGDLPLVWAHNDCTPWNARIAEGRLGLFDWDDFDTRGLPLADVTYFLASIAFVLDGTEGTRDAVHSYERLSDPTSQGGAFSRCLARYASTVGLREADIPRLRIATWVMLSANNVAHLVADASRPLSQTIETSECVPILRAELRSYER